MAYFTQNQTRQERLVKSMFFFTLLYIWGAQMMFAQEANLSKLSPMLRRYVIEQRLHRSAKSLRSRQSAEPMVTAFVKLNSTSSDVLAKNRCRVWAQFGDVYIATVPMTHLPQLSIASQVIRIEANRSSSCLMDSALMRVNALPVYEGLQLPQAFTGKGVVMGIMDIGFDLTLPNFYSADMKEYRVKALWDMLSKDTLQSDLPVGREYVGRDDLLALAHSADGLDQYHGSHTLGIAAGCGGEGVPMSVPGKYHGVAYDSDICLVANATTDNQELIDSSQLYKFTYAMDALGFKYIFDYADKVGKPCVISFSEGSRQDFGGEDILYQEVLDSLTSKPGHIIVSSAGNNGQQLYYIHKPRGRESAGTFVNHSRDYVFHVAKSADAFTMRTQIFQGNRNPLAVDVTTEQVLATSDSIFSDTVDVAGRRYAIIVGAYPSCYHPEEICYDWMVQKVGKDDEPSIGAINEISYQVLGVDADVEVYHGSGSMYNSSTDPSLCDAELTHSINSPSSYESVICVGATVNRAYSIGMNGKPQNVQTDPVGGLSSYSSIGPTYDNRVKPDVMAPGINVTSSFNHFFVAQHPDAWVVTDCGVGGYNYQNDTYTWNCISGTSMSSPIVGGAIALWLQANPHLTREDVMDIIRKTSRPLDDAHTVPNNDWGYGEIDVYRGMLAALQVDGISQISVHQPRKAWVGIEGSKVVVRLEEKATRSSSIKIYNTAGVRLHRQTLSPGDKEIRVDVSHLPSGIYIVQVDGMETATGSTLIHK